MNTQYARHNVATDGRCQSCGKMFRESTAEISIRRNSPLVESVYFARTELIECVLESMLFDEERAALINCSEVADPLGQAVTEIVIDEVAELERLAKL